MTSPRTRGERADVRDQAELILDGMNFAERSPLLQDAKLRSPGIDSPDPTIPGRDPRAIKTAGAFCPPRRVARWPASLHGSEWASLNRL